jgi:hypothetical protein
MPIYVAPKQGQDSTGYWPEYGPTYPGVPGAELPPDPLDPSAPTGPLPTETEGPKPNPPYVPTNPYVPAGRQLVLTSGAGDVLRLTDPDNGYRVRPGVRGLGMPPTVVQQRAGAGDGTRWQRTRREARVIDIPVQVEAYDTETFAARMARFVAALDDRFGPATLTVYRPDGTARSIPVRYEGGADWEDGRGTGGPLVQLMPCTFVAPDPFFRDAVPQTYGLGLGTDTGVPFIPFGAPLTTSASFVAGELALVNPGDADAPGVWTLTGPGGPWIVNNITDGVGFTFQTPLLDGERVFIDTDAKTVTAEDGTNRYAGLGPSPRLWSVPPGRSRVQVTVEGSTPSSSASLAFQPRWKTGS